MEQRKDIRNIAIIAHVDHGKTTLVDGMLKQSKVFHDRQDVGERILDSNAIERERGITILAKNTAVTWGGIKINIVDTPGHADFGGEVERVLNMVDGVLLLVDAVEGPMPQTRFVLRKALAMGHRVIVVINKVDRKFADPEAALNQTFDLFIELGATEEQTDFPVVYAIGISGRAGLDAHGLANDLSPLFETIIKEVPGPNVEMDGTLQLLVTSLAYDEYKGQIGIGRLRSGTIKRGMPIVRISADGIAVPGRIQYLFTHHNLSRQEVEEATAGDIVAFGGIPDVGISDTIAAPENPVALPPIRVDAPTVRMSIGVNTSPFSGREGKFGTSRKLRERLYSELQHDVALRVEDGDSPDTFMVSGRGELHLGILIENMRREGYEFQVSKPEVIFREDPETGVVLEPVEEVHVEVADEAVGTVIEMLGVRRGQMIDMSTESGTTYIKYLVPTRGLLGFRQQFLTATSGMGQIHSLFYAYEPLAGDIPERNMGSLVAWENGTATAYGLENASSRGALFVEPGTEVYEGMVIGQNARAEDLAVNVAKKKHVTNHRDNGTDNTVRAIQAVKMSLDESLDYLAEDELLEVTPLAFRIRKRILDTESRQKELKKREKQLQS